MNEWVRRSLSAGALTAGAVMATGAAAHADTTMISKDNVGILNGTQVFAPIQAPINLCGVAAAVGGAAAAGCEGGSAASTEGLYDVTMLSRHNVGILNGTQAFLPIQAPINICGVAAGVIGSAHAGCEGGSSAVIDDEDHGRHHRGHHRWRSEESSPAAEVVGTVPVIDGLTRGLPLAGGLADLPRTLPAPVSGLSQSLSLGGLPVVGPLLGGVLGGSSNGIDVDSLDSTGTGMRTESEGERTPCGSTCPTPPRPQPPCECPPDRDHHHHDHDHGRDVNMISTGNVGILNGTQVYAPIQVPIDVSGIAVAVIGQASASSEGGSSARM